MSKPTIQWYPGHIAKAEKQLKKNLDKVDLIIEVRDARIPISTSHPNLNTWTKGKKHLLVINRIDMISKEARKSWEEWFKYNGQTPLWCNAKNGKGVKQLKEAAIQSGSYLNSRRTSRGMLKRPIRALTLGFPNVGKSALINRLTRKKVVESARKAGVTRTLRWVRLGQEIDLLDAPGVLPTRLDNQEAAIKLALCDDIGQASYDVEIVTIAFLGLLQKISINPASGVKKDLLTLRYGEEFNPNKIISEEWLQSIANKHASGDKRRMAQKILDDFRKSFLGLISLELPL